MRDYVLRLILEAKPLKLGIDSTHLNISIVMGYSKSLHSNSNFFYSTHVDNAHALSKLCLTIMDFTLQPTTP
jgi:hypothetical protein